MANENENKSVEEQVMVDTNIDYKNPEKFQELLAKKDLALEEKQKTIEKWFNAWTKSNSELTDAKQQLEDSNLAKNRYQKEYLRANKTIVEKESKEKTPTDSFLQDLISKIN